MNSRQIKIIAAGLLLAGSAFGQQSSTPITPTQRLQQQQQQAAQDAQKATVQGTVFKAGAGFPLKKVRVTIRRTDLSGAQTGQLPTGQTQTQPARNTTVQTTTDDAGHYLVSVDPGQYRVSVDHDGYIHQEYGQKSYSGSGTNLTITAAQKLENIDFKMSPAGTITGHVTDEDGEPLVRAQVTAQSYTYSQGKRTLAQNSTAETNDLGEYRLYWLAPGDYYISATARRGGNAGGPRGGGPGGLVVPGGPRGGAATDTETYVSTYFPGTTVPESASTVGLGPAAEVRGIDINLRPMPTVYVRGRAVVPVSFDMNSQPSAPSTLGGGRGGPQRGPTPQRGPQVSISLTRSGINGRNSGFGGMGGGGVGRTSVADDGSFEVQGVIPGTYTLTAVSRQGMAQYTARSRIEVGDSDVNNVGLTLRPSVNVIGRITLDGQPSASFQITSMHVSLVSTDESQQFGGGANTQVNADGTFTLSNIAPLEYRVRISGLPTGSFLQAGSIGSMDAVNAPFDVPGDHEVSMQLVVSFAVGKVQGTVVDAKGDPYLGAITALVPDEPSRQRSELYLSSPSDQYGHFTFNNVPKGGYKLFAWDDIPTGAYQDPDFIRQYEDHGKPIKVEALSTVMEQIKIITANR